MDVFKDIKVIVFDVDGTLTNDISWYNITQELGADQEMHRQIFQDFKAGLITYPKAKDDLIKIWQSTGNANNIKYV